MAREASDVSLSEIPGVGSKTAAKLVAYFGGEREALEAIRQCRFSQLAEAVGAATAARILHGLHKLLYGRWPRDVAATDDAWKLYTTAKQVIEKRVSGKAGRDVLSCLLPLPSAAVEEARRRLRLVERIVELLAAQDTEAIEKLRRILSGVDWPRPVRIEGVNRSLIVVAASRTECEAIREKLGGIVRVVCVEDPAEVERVAEELGESLVYDPEGLYTGSLPRVEAPLVEEVAPEAIVEYFRVNWRTVNSLLELVEGYGRLLEEVARLVGVDVDARRLLEASEAIRALRGGEISEDVDEEYARLRKALESVDRVADEIELWVNNEMQSRLESLEVRLTAAQFLRLLQLLREGGEGGVDLPEEIYEAYMEVAEEAEKRLAEKLGLAPDEAEVVKGLVPRTPMFPVEIDRGKLSELKSLLRTKLEARRFQILRELASRLSGVKPLVEKLVYIAALLDVAIAEALLVRDGVAGVPEVSGDYLGVGIVEGVEASLVGRNGVQPVSYVVGATPYRPDDTRGERVILLTGANSGGKTTLLKLLCETSLLAQSGLVVFAKKAWVGAFDSVYFFSKPTGMLDAGAFETTLRTLAAIVSTRRERRLILVDELEAATEAGAAARIMAVVVEELCRDPEAVAVIVTHLAREILSSMREGLEGCLRVDGIEAKGLDENYNLIVDRNPRYYYLARSTPELIVRRLLYKSKRSEEQRFYTRLLDALTRG